MKKIRDEDALARMGLIALGSRIKRLGDALQAQAAAALAREADDLVPSQLVVLLDLHHAGTLTVGDLAARLGISQPAVTRMVTALKAQGRIEEAEDNSDARRSPVRLSAAGRRLVDRLERGFLVSVDAAIADVIGRAQGTLMDQIAHVEARLAEAPLTTRITEQDTSKRKGGRHER